MNRTPATTDVTIPTEGASLSGTLRRPSDTSSPHPAALLLVGSGPIDRDSNAKRMPLGVTAAIADRLAEAGIASLRYDKRGVGGSTGDYLAAGLTTEIDDARAALRWLRGQPAVDAERIVVVGHSVGALIAARLAASEQVRGAALLAGTAMTGEEVLTMQAQIVGDLLPPVARAVLRLLRIDLAAGQLKRIARLRRTTEDVVRIQGVRVNARWFREFLDHDPTADLRMVTVPVLAITGERDVQVPAADVERVGDLVRGPFEGHVLAGQSHVFRADPDDRGVRGYRAATREPVDAQLLDLVAAWAQGVLAPADDAHGAPPTRGG